MFFIDLLSSHDHQQAACRPLAAGQAVGYMLIGPISGELPVFFPTHLLFLGANSELMHGHT